MEQVTVKIIPENTEEGNYLKTTRVDLSIFLAIAYIHFSFSDSYPGNHSKIHTPSVLLDTFFSEEIEEQYNTLYKSLSDEGELERDYRESIISKLISKLLTSKEKVKYSELNEKFSQNHKSPEILTTDETKYLAELEVKQDLTAGIDIQWDDWLSDHAAFTILVHIGRNTLSYYLGFDKKGHEDDIKFWEDINILSNDISHQNVTIQRLKYFSNKTIVKYVNNAIKFRIRHLRLNNVLTSWQNVIDLPTVSEKKLKFEVPDTLLQNLAKVKNLQEWYFGEVVPTQYSETDFKINNRYFMNIILSTLFDVYYKLRIWKVSFKDELDWTAWDNLFKDISHKDIDKFRTPKETYHYLIKNKSLLSEINTLLEKLPDLLTTAIAEKD